MVLEARPLRELVAGFSPIRGRCPQAIVKVDHAFLEREGQLALLPTLTVAGELRQSFLVRLAQREDGITVRLDPLTDPEKTPAVHAALAFVARWVRDSSPGARFGPTNIAPALESTPGA